MAKDPMLAELQKINSYAEYLFDDTLSSITDFISTGSLSLNAVVSGDFFKGFPVGRISTLSGPSGVGKSLISGCSVREAQKKGYTVVWFDSEWATDSEFLERLGVDTKKILKIPVGTVEEFKNQCFKILEVFGEKFPDKKLFFVLDSLGNLASEKELGDTSEGKNASDMGQRAKVIKSTLKILTDKLGKQKATLVLINHTYQNPGNPYAGSTQSGGMAPVYVSYVIVNFTKSKVKDTEKTLTGMLLKGTTDKNRLVPHGKTGEVLLDFEKGLDKYYGLLELGEASGLILKEGKKFKTKYTDKLYWEKDLYCGEFFEPILKELNEYSIKSNCYSSINEVKELSDGPMGISSKIIKEGEE